MAVNLGVPIMYPRIRAEVGARALYVDAPARHVMVEFAFDVLRVAKGGYVAQAYRDRIGFDVSKSALERAVRETYALDLGDLLMSVDLAIGTYRRAVSTTIPELTRIAWHEHREEIEQRSPGIAEQTFVYTYSPADYDRDFGSKYRKPGFLARMLSVLLKIVPKIGPFRPLAFEPLTPQVEELFVESTEAARRRYRAALRAVAPTQLRSAEHRFRYRCRTCGGPQSPRGQDLRRPPAQVGEARVRGRARYARPPAAGLLRDRGPRSPPRPLLAGGPTCSARARGARLAESTDHTPLKWRPARAKTSYSDTGAFSSSASGVGRSAG